MDIRGDVANDTTVAPQPPGAGSDERAGMLDRPVRPAGTRRRTSNVAFSAGSSQHGNALLRRG